jgi:hypothetical protein
MGKSEKPPKYPYGLTTPRVFEKQENHLPIRVYQFRVHVYMYRSKTSLFSPSSKYRTLYLTRLLLGLRRFRCTEGEWPESRGVFSLAETIPRSPIHDAFDEIFGSTLCVEQTHQSTFSAFLYFGICFDCLHIVNKSVILWSRQAVCYLFSNYAFFCPQMSFKKDLMAY